MSAVTHDFTVIVIGGGHAGTEAALAAARKGVKTLLLTQNIDTLGQMSCNPAIGGIGKTHLVKEIDALGGVMARAADVAGIQFRVLNARKGPAVRATRAQADRILYKQAIRQVLEQQDHLHIFQQSVEDLVIEQNRVAGVVTQMGLVFSARAVVLTTGTFLGGVLHIGLQHHQGGRAGDAPSNKLATRLRDLSFRVGRLKTGTPPRIAKSSVDFGKMLVQPGDVPLPVMSYLGQVSDHPQQIPCYITRTTEQTHDIIRQGLDQSPLYSGKIESTGPRYCPSIEDKIVRFSDKNSHQIFVEPEGLTSGELYPNGISTSLAFTTQLALVRSIPGFAQAEITRPGYAIEYDFFDPRDLKPSLETKVLQHLFFAGQINGTTGYEEAAAQGLIAGINAAQLALDQEPFVLRRDQAYIGVLIDDLITHGTKEPYRMFTSRAECRLLLREDNADVRLTELGYQFGLVDQQRWQAFQHKMQQAEKLAQYLQVTRVQPESEAAQILNTRLKHPLRRAYNLHELLLRPELVPEYLPQPLLPKSVAPEIYHYVAFNIKYAGYVARQQQEIERTIRHEAMPIPRNFNYTQISGLSREVQEKLQQVQPATIAMAGRIAGVTPAAVSLLLIYLKKHHGSTGL